MRKSTKVLIVILILLIICLIGYIAYIYTQDNKEIDASVAENEIVGNTVENNIAEENTTNEISNTTDTENQIDTNTIQQNTTNTQTEEQPDNTDVVGKEEQESNQESGGVNLEQKAIELAKQKWGDTASNFVFTIDQVQGNIYHIAVISNAKTIAYMDVNIDTGEVIEND